MKYKTFFRRNHKLKGFFLWRETSEDEQTQAIIDVMHLIRNTLVYFNIRELPGRWTNTLFCWKSMFVKTKKTLRGFCWIDTVCLLLKSVLPVWNALYMYISILWMSTAGHQER